MYDEIYETFKEVAGDNIHRDLFNHSTESAEALIEDIKNSKIVIYTAFTGGYDSLKEPDFIDENCDYVCFTDSNDLTSDIWDIRLMEDSTLDNNRKAKQFKVLPHKYFPEYKYSFWLDGTFKIKGSLREYIYKNIRANSNMLCVVHTERDCIYEEYKASKIIPRYPRAVMEEQINTYREDGFPAHYGMGVMGSIFRKHNSPDVIELMDAWWEEIIKFTNQDQLSFAYVCWKCDFHPSVSLVYYWENEYWAKDTAKKDEYHHKTVPVTPIVSENLLEEIRDKYENMGLDDSLELSREELYLLINDVKGLAGYRIDTAGRIGFLNNELHKIYSSNSMKVTKPLRFASNLARRVKNSSPEVKAIKNLEIFDENVYKAIHGECKGDAVSDYIVNGSLNDSIETKKEYIDPIFDLDYYRDNLNLTDDPLMHFIRNGPSIAINSEGQFITSFKEPALKQYDEFISDKIKKELDSNYYITDSEILEYYITSDKVFNTKTRKIGVFLEDTFEDMNACPYIRIHALFKELSKTGKYHFFIFGKEMVPFLEDNEIINTKVFDAMVIQRLNPLTTTLLKKAKKHKIGLVYETDDDLIHAESSNPSFNYLYSNRRKLFDLVYYSDAVTVSTDALDKRLNNDKTFVIKNYHLKDALPIKSFSDNNKQIKIGYFGTKTHDEDLESVREVFSSLDSSKFKLEVIGAVNSNADWYDSIPLPDYPMPAESFYNWLSKTVDWDIGIVPLVSSNINECKSELKFIEFTALGVPVVASPLDAYLEAICDGEDGFIASSTDEWISKLELLINDSSLRESIVANAQKKIAEDYAIESRVTQWDNLFRDLLS